ncbi:MCU domain-containing protein [Mycena kentingensis (nom. inval.)]|nr:MCU domain-containing protein [Mycena kentingensis (nom. inval.)]
MFLRRAAALSDTLLKSRWLCTRASYSTTTQNTAVTHSQFLSNAPPARKWKERDNGDDLDELKDGNGKLSPTSSHLFKLILPLGTLRLHPEKRVIESKAENTDEPPTVLLLHPSQPLSHIARLIQASLPFSRGSHPPDISFRSGSRQPVKWSDSTDVGDFIRDAARSANFSIHFSYPSQSDTSGSSSVTLDVRVPTVADRTHFLRRRLTHVSTQLADMEALKRTCDAEAHRGARRMATMGFGMLVVYWGVVARLTFWDYGWDVMEPITYLSGLSTVICGYLWFLYQGREVSYSSVLDRSISARRETLYKARGLDIDRWSELRAEARSLKREIGRIEEDYDDHEASEEEEEEEEEEDVKEQEKE